MIAWLSAAVRESLLEPQCQPSVHADRRCTLDDSATPPDYTTQPVMGAAALRLVSASSAPLRYEIGGAMTVRHTLTISLAVTDGDELRGEERRDAIMLDVVSRMYADPTLGGAEGPGGQDISSPMAWRIDYTPLGSGLPAMYAALELTADVDLYPLVGR